MEPKVENKSQAPSSSERTPDLSKSKSKKLFFLGGGHSRNSSLNSLMGDEAEAAVLLGSASAKPKGTQDTSIKPSKEADSSESEACKRRCKVSGSCMCKLSVVFYLAGCILISALYVVFFGKNQPLFGEAWIPGKPTVHGKPTPKPQVYFEDLPYTEWLSQRWTYQESPFADWPSLPEEVEHIQQMVSGQMGGSGGLWLLTNTQLFFVHGLHGGDPDNTRFVNVSQELDIEVTMDSYMATKLGSTLYLISSYNVTYLDCSHTECEVLSTACEVLPFDTVLSSCFSMSEDTLWLGTNQGLFTLSTHHQDDCLAFSNVSQVEGAVQTLAWRSAISDADERNPTLHSFVFKPSAKNHLQKNFACSNCHGSQWTGGYWTASVEHGFGVLVVGTNRKLYFYDGKEWWFEWVSGVPTALTFGPSGELYIADYVSLTRVNIDYSFDRIGPLQGLPYNQLTSLHVSPYVPVTPPLTGPAPEPANMGTLWIGTARGYTLFNIKTSKFIGYFNGPRWLPEGSVLSIAGSGSTVVILTEEGLAVVHPEMWTLASKARHFQAMLQRHTRPPGLVSDCPITSFTASTCSPSTTDSDGLWTSWVVAAEAFRYKVTKETSARTNSWHLFSGLKFLVNVTDVEGLMARSVVGENSTVDGPEWYDSSSIPGWRWKGDTSSDEVVGHMWVYPLVHDLVAQGEPQQKVVQDLLGSIVDYIKGNGYVLLDVGNHSTRGGVWSPSQLNLNQSWAEEKGVNSLQMLSYLLSAYRITKNTHFLQAFKELFSGRYEDVPTNYGRNMINQKATFPSDDNFSDDDLSFLPYFLYYYSLKHMEAREIEKLGPQAEKFANLSFERTWRLVEKGKSSLWMAIFTYITGDVHRQSVLEELVWNLRTWPLELIEWRTHNSHRLDIRLNPEQDRNLGSGSQSVEVLPANERSQLRWNANPFLLDSEGSSREMDPGPWLLPYWMARWSGVL